MSVRRLDEEIKQRLKVRAARNGRSMEAEIRAILTAAVRDPEKGEDLFLALLDRFGEVGGVELTLPPRSDRARPAELPR